MIKLDVTLFIQMANFLLLMAVLHFLLYKPLRRIMQQRRETVDQRYGRAQELDEAINDRMQRYQQKLDQARQQGSQEAAQMRQEAVAKERQMLTQAREEAEAHMQQVRSQVAQESEQASAALRKQTRQIGVEIASTVLGRKVK